MESINPLPVTMPDAALLQGAPLAPELETSWLESIAPRRIVVFRALQLGGMLCAVPALRALRAAAPDAQITLVGLPWAASFARRFSSYLDDFITFPGHPFMPEQAAPDALTFDHFVHQVRNGVFDLALQLHDDGDHSNAIVQQFGAHYQAGFVPSLQDEPLDFSLVYPDEGSEVRRLLALTSALGAPSWSEQLEFPLDSSDQEELAECGLLGPTQQGGYVCLHPGARSAAKRWDTECFAQIGDALHQRYGLKVVLTGYGAERAFTAEVAAHMHAPVQDAAGDYSAGALAALIKGAALLVCNDTGVSQLAAALQVPSVVVFLSTDSERWAPLDSLRHRCVHLEPQERDQTGVPRVLMECDHLMALASLQPAC